MCFEQATRLTDRLVPVAVRSGLSRPPVDAPVDGAHSRVSSSSFAGCTR